MKITLDTNVLISAIFWNGDSNSILEYVEKGELTLILSKDILEELIRVLNYKDIQDKIVNKNLEMSRTVEKIATMSIIIQPRTKLYIVTDDPDDNKILECAKAGNVYYVVSSDIHLLELKRFENIIILTPKEFMRIMPMN
jgi:putative PIN family toxin of toxin-antitoxin system